MIFETHAHYDDKAFEEDRDELIKGLYTNKVDKVVNVASNLDSIDNTLRLIEEYDFFYGALGIHPSDSGDLTDEDMEYINSHLKDDKVVAVGEIGLDYHYDEPDRDIQKKWFVRQIDMARNMSLPMIIHSRDAAKDTLDIMQAEKCRDIGGVIHCYSYSVEMARDFLDMNFYIGVGGVVTFKNAQKLKDVVEYLPLDRIVTETDSPYLAPTPHRGQRNNSTYIPLVIDEISRIKGIDRLELEEILYNNALSLYRMENR